MIHPSGVVAKLFDITRALCAGSQLPLGIEEKQEKIDPNKSARSGRQLPSPRYEYGGGGGRGGEEVCLAWPSLAVLSAGPASRPWAPAGRKPCRPCGPAEEADRLSLSKIWRRGTHTKQKSKQDNACRERTHAFSLGGETISKRHSDEYKL